MTKEEEGNVAGIGHLDSAVHSTGVSISASSVGQEGGGGGGAYFVSFFQFAKKTARDIARLLLRGLANVWRKKIFAR